MLQARYLILRCCFIVPQRQGSIEQKQGIYELIKCEYSACLGSNYNISSIPLQEIKEIKKFGINGTIPYIDGVTIYSFAGSRVSDPENDQQIISRGMLLNWRVSK